MLSDPGSSNNFIPLDSGFLFKTQECEPGSLADTFGGLTASGVHQSVIGTQATLADRSAPKGVLVSCLAGNGRVFSNLVQVGDRWFLPVCRGSGEWVLTPVTILSAPSQAPPTHAENVALFEYDDSSSANYLEVFAGLLRGF